MSAAVAGLAACGRRTASTVGATSRPGGLAPGGSGPTTLDGAVAGAWRSGADRMRDAALHPAATLSFFDLRPGMTVVEVWPGAGWWTGIIAPFLAATHGKLYAASFEAAAPGDPASKAVVAAYQKMLTARPALYGDVTITAFGPRSGPLAPGASADLVLFAEVLDHWMAAGLAEKAFHDAFSALKPGGALGLLQARGAPGGVQDPLAANGKVQVAFVKQLATEAGFRFNGASEINAASKAAVPGAPPPRARPLLSLPEPDRMTLRFIKPR